MIIFIACLSVVLIYAHWIEPLWIEVTHHRIHAPVKNRIRIAHLSDLHIKKFSTREQRLLKLLRVENPDVILISGDSISDSDSYNEVGEFLKLLRAPLGVWLVRGNWEHWRPNKNEANIYKNAGVHFLNNDNYNLRDNVWIIGLDDNLAGNPQMNVAQEGIPEDAFKIGLFHSPDFFKRQAQRFNMVLAGHTHGGQVRIPFLPPLWLPEGSGPYVEGWYHQDLAQMYVSRGIGNSIMELRFFCRPELPIIDIEPI